jgi:hypothetical protein
MQNGLFKMQLSIDTNLDRLELIACILHGMWLGARRGVQAKIEYKT